ncbi:MAG: hypothetical protein IKT03_08615, partial [Muribaculaceae bacterium]|nr:hypothetical protein [Muribaculaceae bacterium]
MEKKPKNRIKKIVLWTLGIVILLIILLPFSLYIPWVQNKAKDVACHYVKQKTGMDLSIGRILVKFPLDISLDDMSLLGANGDTMIVAKNFTANVAFMPLFDKRLEIDGAELTDAKYRLVSDDASMLLRADVNHCKLTGSHIDLDNNKINVLDGELTGGKVMLSLNPYKSYDDNDTTKSKPWRIEAKHLVLNDVDYMMDMQPTIDKLTTHLARAELNDGVVDTGLHTVDAKSLKVDGIDAKYVYPTSQWAKWHEREYPVTPSREDPSDTIPWTVKSDTLSVKGGHLVYAEKGRKPANGLDMNYVEVSDLDFTVTDFYNRGSIVSVPIKDLKAKERGGLEIKQAQGTALVNSQDIQVKDFNVTTRNSTINLDGKVDMSILDENPTGSMKLTTNSSVDLREIGSVMPSLRKYTNIVPSKRPIKVKGTFEGNTRDLDINNGTIDIPGYVKADVDGNIKNVTDPKKLSADVNINADINNVDFAKREFLDKDLQQQVNVVPMKVKGNVKYSPGNVSGDVDMRLTSGGSLVGKGSYNLNNDSYNVDATAKSLPVKKILPKLDVNNVTAHVKAKGHGFDFLQKNTNVDAQVQLTDIDYAGKHYRNYDADVKLNGNNFDAKVNARNRGTLAAKGNFDPKSERYDVDAKFNSFPVNEIAPQLGVGPLTANIKAKGEKFDFLNPSTRINADIDLGSVVYNNQTYKDLKGNIALDGNSFEGHINSTNPNCDLYADVNGTINGDVYNVDLKGKVRDLDLKALKLMDVPSSGSGEIALKGEFNVKNNTYKGTMHLTDLDWNHDGEPLFTEMTDLTFNADSHSTSASFNEGSTYVNFSSPNSINDLMKNFDKITEIAKRQYKKIDLDANELCDALPQFDMDLKMGPNGLIQRYLGKWDIDFRDVQASISNDSLLRAHAVANNVSYGTNAIDRLIFNVIQDGDMIGFSGRMDNNKGTWDDMAEVNLAGSLQGSNVNFLVSQLNIKDEMGYHFGMNATIQDSVIHANIMPKQPVIAYRHWNINDENYIKIDFGDKRLEADLALESDSSFITLKTDPLQEAGSQRILADIKNVKIEEWTNLIPSLEPMTGVLNADMAINYDGTNVEGDGEVELLNFTYKRMHEGDLKMKTNLTIDPATSSTHITANLDIDGSNVAVAYGALNDSTASSPFNLKVDLNKFPIRKLSPFIPGRMVMLDGYANGDLSVDGAIDNPIINGYLVSDT